MDAVNWRLSEDMKDQNHTMKPAGAIGALALIAVLAGCSGDKDKILFDGYDFRSKTAPVDKKRSRADFTVTIKDATRSLDGAREAGRYQGTRYCIANYGNSDIDWAVGPDTDPAQLRIVDGDLSFQGTCQRP